MFLVCFAYNIIACEKNDVADYGWVWKMKCVERLKMFIWLLLKDKLLTNVERRQRKMIEYVMCLMCEEEDENISHIFRNYKKAIEVWRRTLSAENFNSRSFATVNVWIKDNCLSGVKLSDGDIWGNKFINTI